MSGDLRTAFEATVKANREILPELDAAVIEAGRAIADQIDYAIDNLTGQDLTKALYLMPHLMNVLKEMLATPAARKAVGIAGGKDDNGGTLGKLRLAHGRGA